jgi:hypothetical protein
MGTTRLFGIAVAVAVLIGGVSDSPADAQEAPPPPATHGRTLFDEPGLLTSAFDFAGRFMPSGEGERRDGFYPKIGGMISGAGWIALGPGYRQQVLDDRAMIEASAGLSWRGFMRADAGFEFPLLADGRLATGVEALWQDSTQLNYFGLGPDSSEDLRSQYRLQTMNIVGYARYRPERWLAVSGRFGWLDRPSVASATGPFKPDALDAQAAFPTDPAMTIPEQPQFLHGEVAITADTRDHADHPARGALYRASAGMYSADQRRYSFRRYEVEGLQTLPFGDGLWTVVLRGWGVFANASPDQEIPFYLMPALGGASTLRGYSNYRFHDRHLLLANAESRLALFPHVDAAVFVDAGTVAARVSDLGFDRTAYGFGFRLHTHKSTIGRVDVARNDEGWHVMFRSNDPLNLKRVTRWMAAVPFVP